MIEYRVKRVERFIVTRYESGSSNGLYITTGLSRQFGKEFDNFETAYEVGYALAKADKERLGLGPGDDGVIFPSDSLEEARYAEQGNATPGFATRPLETYHSEGGAE